MNKTLTVNISGIVFHIEEHAFHKLEIYLNSVKGYFTSAEGRDEIIQDIEARIAEIFQERMKNKKDVIEGEDINELIRILGQPEDFAGEQLNEKPAEVFYERKKYKRIYRDPDDKMIAGVCSGISQRLNIDPVWLRILFIVFIFFGGGGILIYIILAIVLPKASTTAQKLEMKGKGVTLSSIKQAFESPEKKNDFFISRFFDVLGDIFLGIVKILVYIIGGILAFIGLIMLFGLSVALLAVLGVSGITIPILISDLFLTHSQQFWAMMAIILVIGIPVLLLFYTGIKILFRIRHTHRIFKITLWSLWIIGVFIALITGFRISREFVAESKIRAEIPLINPSTDTLFVDVMKNPQYDEEEKVQVGFGFGRRMSVTTGEEFSMQPENVQLDIEKAEGENFELTKIASSRGMNKDRAHESAAMINYNLSQEDSLLMFSPFFPLTENVKYRDQKVRLILKVPVGKSVHLGNNISWIIYDIDNVSNTWDGDMINKTWTMTDKGLECLSCEFPPEENTDGEWIDANDSRVRINKNGINIKAKNDSSEQETEIKINEHGVQINTNKK